MSRKRKIIKWSLATVLIGGFASVILGTLGILWVFYAYGRDLPDYGQLANYEPDLVSHVHAGDGSLLTEFATEERIFVPIDYIPNHLRHAFISAEDKKFYSHIGLDFMGITRAVLVNMKNVVTGRRLVGASTITQQVARNFLLTNDVSWERKIREQILALRIERAYSKDKILELYMNQIYLGLRSYGVAAASLNYFNKALDEITLAEAAYLAAIPKGPSNYHPVRNHDRAFARRNWVLERMFINGYITREEADEAQAQPLISSEGSVGRVFRADYFLEDVRREVVDLYGSNALYKGGLTVRTTLEPRAQIIAEKALRNGLIAYDRRHGWRGPLTHVILNADWRELLKNYGQSFPILEWQSAIVLEVDAEKALIGLEDESQTYLTLEGVSWARSWLPGERLGPKVEAVSDVVKPGNIIAVSVDANGLVTLQQVPEIQGALVAMDPHTGRVYAMVGGFDFERSEFNRASQAKRQPGSAFKPFVYGAGLEAGLTPSSIVLDARFALDQGQGQGIWKPRNSSNKFYGPSTLRLGLELSRNLMTVRLAQAIGMERVQDIASRFDISDDLQPTLAMSLGAAEVSPLDMTAAYGVLVNGGKDITPTLIDRIQDRYGATIFKHDERSCMECQAETWQGQMPPVLPDDRKRVMDARTAYQIVHMLEGVVERGTGRRIRSLGRSLAGKTGTTNEEKDAWFMGFSPDLVVGVFTGFDDPRSLGRREEGSSVAAPIFKEFMGEYLKGSKDVPFRIPSGIRMVRVNSKTGAPPHVNDPPAPVILEAFIPGTEPKPGERRMVDGSGTLVQTEGDLRNEAGGIY